MLRRDFSGKEAASANGAEQALYITLPQGRRVVLAVGSANELESWRFSIQQATVGATVDSNACRPLPCAPAVVKERAIAGVPDCFRGIVWHKLAGADALSRKYPSRYLELLQRPSRDDARIGNPYTLKPSLNSS